MTQKTRLKQARETQLTTERVATRLYTASLNPNRLIIGSTEKP
jgi:hypothetical protein